NPHECVSSNADVVLHEYAAEYRDTTPGRIPLPPHVFQLATNAYYHMRRTGQDQSRLFSGETASGKSENHSLSLLELSVSNPGQKGSKLANQVSAAEFVINSLKRSETHAHFSIRIPSVSENTQNCSSQIGTVRDKDSITI
ncbi:hypothetical protein SCLCIDRAFT_1160112, partial [Scleroderma citrinum Foug A]